MQELILKGIRQEGNRYTLGVSKDRIRLPEVINSSRADLQFKFESCIHRVDPKHFFDKGERPTAEVKLEADINRDSLYLYDANLREPQAARARGKSMQRKRRRMRSPEEYRCPVGESRGAV